MLQGAILVFFVILGKFLSALFGWLSFKLKKDVLQGTVTDENHWDSYNKKGKVNGKEYAYTISTQNDKGETVVYSCTESLVRRSKAHYQKGDVIRFRLIESSAAEDGYVIKTGAGLLEDVKKEGADPADGFRRLDSFPCSCYRNFRVEGILIRLPSFRLILGRLESRHEDARCGLSAPRTNDRY